MARAFASIDGVSWCWSQPCARRAHVGSHEQRPDPFECAHELVGGGGLDHAAATGEPQRLQHAGKDDARIVRRGRGIARERKREIRGRLQTVRGEPLARRALVSARRRGIGRIAGNTELLGEARRQHRRPIADGEHPVHRRIGKRAHDLDSAFVDQRRIDAMLLLRNLDTLAGVKPGLVGLARRGLARLAEQLTDEFLDH